MKLKVIGSSSSGNCYLLESAQETLMIECGVNIKFIKRALNFDLSTLRGVLITHSHADHCSAVAELTHAGVKVFASPGTCEEIGQKYEVNAYRMHPKKTKLPFSIGNFRVMPFDVVHDTKEPVGYLIEHPDMGLMLFLTDTVYAPYKFPGLNHLVVEANYCEDILEERRSDLATIETVRNRVIESHMSIQNCHDLLKSNDLSAVRNIVLIHLSSAHSNARQFKRSTERLTGKSVCIADVGVEVDFSKSPF